jgi:predicted restriction endonuclease
LDQAIERLYDLHPGVTPVGEGSPHERPHKPLLLLAALDLIDEGLATPDRIPWCQALRDRFSARFLLVRKHNDQNTPENPFFRLQTQGFWEAWIEHEPSTARQRPSAKLHKAPITTHSGAAATTHVSKLTAPRRSKSQWNSATILFW